MTIHTALQAAHDAIVLTHARIKDVNAIRDQLTNVVIDLLELMDEDSKLQHIDYFQEKMKPFLAELAYLDLEVKMRRGCHVGMSYLLNQ